ncbi:MAG: outer membrane beta-barrel protein [Lentimicrobiaceae bacterium]|nr:outer membrane beta-barrel protein [Lentimicrobiaceae bacterium]
MKKILFTILMLSCLKVSYGQTTEIRVALNSGLFSFAGNGAESVTFINYDEVTNSGNTNNPYGSRGGLGIGLSANVIKIATNNTLVGVDLGYELLRSKIKINSINSSPENMNMDAEGRTYLNANFINLNVFLGYRLAVNNINIDFTGGADVAYNLSSRESGRATASNGYKVKTSTERKAIDFDIRPGIKISANYNKTGAYLGYSLGLVNYKADLDGGKNEACYASILRFGLTYQIN